MIKQLTQKLKYRLSLPLPGIAAHTKMAHAERKRNLQHYKTPANAINSAVLILLFPDEHAIKTILIVRQQYEGVHSGQVAFPGGKREEIDTTFADTAIREAHEETGILKQDVEIIGQLTPLYIPPSNFLVHPFIGSMNTKPDFYPNTDEVQKLIEVNIESFSDESIEGEKEITLNNGLKLITPYYNIQGYTVWGATAMIISEFKTLMNEMEG